MFLGEYEHTIDQKGRLAIPVKFRAALADGVVVSKNVDSCLTVYPKKQWEELAAKVASLPITHPQARSFARHILAGAADADIDRQGRIIIPQNLRQYASLGSSVIVAGIFDRLEIWNKEQWDKSTHDVQAHSSDIASSLADLGI